MAIAKRVTRLMNPHRPTRRRNISAGFVDAAGFHPIRSAGDYDSARAGERAKKKSKSKAKTKVKTKTKTVGKKRAKRSNPAAPKRNAQGQFIKRSVARKRTAAKRKARTVRRKRVATTYRANPALIYTLGALNPHTTGNTKGKKMATKKKTRARRKRTAVAAPRRARRRNPRKVTRRVRAAAPAPRKRRRNSAAGVRRRVRRYMRRRNSSSVYGTRILSSNGLSMIAGGLGGVAGVKIIGGFIPAGFRRFGVLGDTLIAGATAVGLGMLATKFLGQTVGNAVTFGGLMYAGSVGINGIAPGLRVMDTPLTLNGMGVWAPASFPIPSQTVLTQGAYLPAPAGAPNVDGMGGARGFPSSFR